MHSTTSTKRGVGSSGNGSLVTRHQARNRNRYTISAINSVIASSTGIQLPGDSAAAESVTSDTYPNGGGHLFSLQTLEEEGVELGPVGPHYTDIDLNSGLETEKKLETVT